MRYAIWNNKGGVGKSFLTFVFASEYAAAHRTRPSTSLICARRLTSRRYCLAGTEPVRRLCPRCLMLTSARRSGDTLTSGSGSHTQKPDRDGYTVNVHSKNSLVPKNLYLVAGDPSLEVQAEAINQIANQSLPADSWKNVHSWLDDLCAAITERTPNSTFFIDCNPSFAAYTELAIVAARKMIVPCSADGSSARAIGNIGQLVYGHGVPQQYKGLCSPPASRMRVSVRLVLPW